jgi:hypothetical protein
MVYILVSSMASYMASTALPDCHLALPHSQFIILSFERRHHDGLEYSASPSHISVSSIIVCISFKQTSILNVMFSRSVTVISQDYVVCTKNYD